MSLAKNPMDSTFSGIINGEAQVLVTPALPLTRRSGISRGGLMPTIRVQLISRKHPNLFALIDAEDADLVNQFRWWANVRYSGKIYPWTRVDGTFMYLHRLLLHAATGDVIDHANGQTLDNRRCNLRLCTNSENSANRMRLALSSSSFRGVNWDSRYKKWRASIKAYQKNFNLGRYTSETEAAHAYDAAAREHFGEFARLNFPQEGEQQA